jgi:hypothetical protein
VTRFTLGQRVTVHAAASPDGANGNIPGGACGTVVRLRRCDDGAWIELDTPAHDDVHPFPADDPRARHVLAYPEDCHHIATAAPR